MQNEQNAGDVQAEVLLEIGQVFMHRLRNNVKTLFTSGTFRIAQLRNNRGEPVHFINLNSFYYGIQPNTFFVKAVYSDTVAYLFPHFQMGLSALSIRNEPALVALLDQRLAEVARLYDLQAAHEVTEVRQLLLEHYKDVQREQIYYPDNVKKVIVEAGNLMGKAFTALGGILKTGVEKAGNYLDSKVAEGEPAQFSEATKQRWQSLKEGTNNVVLVSGELASRLLSPVLNKGKEYGQQLQQRISSSNNQTVKYVKDLAVVSGRAVGEALDGLLKGGAQVTRELETQGKKIIHKKYGPQLFEAPPPHPPAQPPHQGQQLQERPSPLQAQQTGEEAGEESAVRLAQVSSDNLYPSLQK